MRIDYGLAPAANFADITSDPDVQAALANAYAAADDVDPWVGGLAEEHLPDAMVGETFFVIIAEQFERLRDGDRFWYQNYLPPALVHMIERQTLARIIRRNTGIGSELQEDVFVSR